MIITVILGAAAAVALAVWIYLIAAHGRFWLSGPELCAVASLRGPRVDIVVPARDEEQTIGPVIASLLAQDYGAGAPGSFAVTLVDDNSTDATAACAGRAPHLNILRGAPKPAGWVGKMWALEQGIAAGDAPLILLTDADIVHDPRHLSTLVACLEHGRLDMASEMVHLNCSSFAERALVPAFVYFFQMLYPFAKVNDARSGVAAAAGGTVLIRREALRRIGGIGAIKGALIDDVSLAKAVKGSGGGAIFLGHSALATSIRPYPGLADIWRMIARTAFTQLRHSAWLLLGTLLGLTLVWLAPLAAALLGHGWVRVCGLAACALAIVSYLPTLARYRRSFAWALALPLIALFYMAATVGSAIDEWSGAGARWKSRTY
jgi:hopene-associated glycosyltransferase HpnB